MVRFSCFAAPIHHHRPKKVIQHPGRAMHSTSQVAYEDQVVMTSNGSAMANPKMEDNNPSNTSVDQVTSPSSLWKSEDLNDSLSFEDGKDFLQMVHLKKSQSLGCILEQGRSFSFEDASVDSEMDQRFPFSNSHDKDMQKMTDSVKNSASADPYAHGNFHGDKAMNLDHQENDILESFDFNADQAHHHSLFSIGVLKQFDGERLDVAGEKSGDHVTESGCRSFEMLPTLARSRSLINIRAYSDNTTKGAHTHEFMGPRSRSFGDFSLLYRERARFQNRDEALFSGQTFHMPRAASYSFDMSKALNSDGKGSAGPADMVEECKKSGGCNEAVNQDGDGLSWREKVKYGNQSVDGDDSHSYCGLVNGWRQSKTSNLEIRGDLQQGIIIQNDDELTSKEFTKKRIEEWINQIDIQNSFSLEEHVESSKSVGESSKSVRKKDPHIVTDETSAKAEGKSSPGMEAAYNYVSSLTAASSSAQMANLGLAVIPFLGAFVSLRVLNLSGNSIVRITAGALPKGLHMLNLSKNNISTIEGLRELTRLRMLDLSYNRISRIGHGLASCSSLKELYLAGNKISEVEGLHRLLKLNILDLRFNKISTSKGLGQLAANYMSLQAINLEGNPAQRNVGDDQLKKYLVSLLPNLVYFNKQTIRSVSTKEVPDRSTRSITAHKLDHGMRSEHKHSRRVAHGASLHKSAASSSHGRSTHAVGSSVKQSQSRHGHLPLAGSKVVNHLPNISSTLSSLDPKNAIRRIRSEGML